MIVFWAPIAAHWDHVFYFEISVFRRPHHVINVRVLPCCFSLDELVPRTKGETAAISIDTTYCYRADDRRDLLQSFNTPI